MVCEYEWLAIAFILLEVIWAVEIGIEIRLFGKLNQIYEIHLSISLSFLTFYEFSRRTCIRLDFSKGVNWALHDIGYMPSIVVEVFFSIL